MLLSVTATAATTIATTTTTIVIVVSTSQPLNVTAPLTSTIEPTLAVCIRKKICDFLSAPCVTDRNVRPLDGGDGGVRGAWRRQRSDVADEVQRRHV